MLHDDHLKQIMEVENFFLNSLLLVLQFAFCASKDYIAINQTMKDGNLLVSKEKNFALGFFSPGHSSFRYLGIWFHKVPEQTVVWVANRNNPINGSSGRLSIDQYGNLVLYNGHDRKVGVWSTNVTTEETSTCVAQLLDSGNLVLVQGTSGKIVWQSFDYPTDTQLKGMKLGLDRKTGRDRTLTSWRSAEDPGTGDYKLQLNPSGSPQAFLYKGRGYYYRSIPWPWRQYIDVYNVNFVNNYNEVTTMYFLDDASVIMRIVLDDSGYLRRLTWHETDRQWKELGSVPANHCEMYGRCGTFGECDPYNVNGFQCACLPGYEPKYQRDWNLRDGSGGCVRKRLESSPLCGHGEGFLKVEGLKLPDTSSAVWVSTSMSRTNCENECKRNCSCTAYASLDYPTEGTGCLAWYGELMDTMNFLDDGYDLYVRVDALELAENASKSGRFLDMNGLLVLLMLSAASAWSVIIIFACFWIRKRKRKAKQLKWNRSFFDSSSNSDYYKDNSCEHGGKVAHPDNIAVFSLKTILAATNNFSPENKLGQGGFGSVYKGQLSNGQEIAVKRLSKNSGHGIEEFTNEVILIAKLQHRNLVKLLGFCIEREEPFLIYEYMPNKSLDTFLFDDERKSVLDWRKRFEIIFGIARGILYLHQDSRLRVVHRDLKCSNILLDAEMNPRISDFGTARIFNNEQIQDRTNRVVGTYGYMSPEYAVFGTFSVKSDVFSFGVILFEIMSGKKNNHFHSEDPSRTLIGHVWELWREGRALEIVDPSLEESYPCTEALRCIQIGLLCVQEHTMDRPTMLTVVLMLNSETPLPSPKQPAFVFRNPGNNDPCSTLGEERPCSINEATMTMVMPR